MADSAVGEAPAGEQGPAAAVAASATPRSPAKEPAAPAGKGKKAGKEARAEKEGKKKGKAKEAAPPPGDGPSIAAHPRAARGVARAKSWGGLIGFVLGGYLSLPTNTLAAASLRALIAGVACYVVAWAGAVFVWRRLVMLELKGREQQLAARAAGTASTAQRSRPAAAPTEQAGARSSS